MPSKSPTKSRTWLQLLRAPNLFTVAGDPLAGFLLATQGELHVRVVLPVVGSLFLYSAGLLHNDLADLAEDRADRPHRPLPSGAASPRSVGLVALGLVLLALASSSVFLGMTTLPWTAPLGVTLCLTAAIFLYNQWTKHIRGAGALNMGLCRGLSLLLGAAAALPTPFGRFAPEVWTAALVSTAYIAAVTNLASYETKANAPKSAKWLPLAALIVGALILAFQRFTVVRPAAQHVAGNFTAGILILFTMAVVGMLCRKLASLPNVPPPAIGEFIRLLLPLQAAYCAAWGTVDGIVTAILLLIVWPMSRAVSRRFYAS